MPSLDCDPNFFLDISSSWLERSLHAEFQLPRKLFHYYSGRVGGGQRLSLATVMFSKAPMQYFSSIEAIFIILMV